ncbi:ribonuclease [Goodfellowiella coeruleoviolacea]|uniref:Ribonuclease T1 n=1 Tax=Goodfellowiella coeruleoviolacea TaxID=334858 RepID=A0AAE3GMV7_9PSEU|nr:ribonuclease [Goodfellowiella coeruleoviolacea]MCP2170324.1 ribonuclease T1 [Goodfellowiella coeruleoviolacea]
MNRITASMAKTLAAFLLAVVGVVGLAATSVAAPGAAPTLPTSAVSTRAACGNTSGFHRVDLSDLPSQATDTVELILAGGPFPYPQDGTVFQNREGLLPTCASGYYHEYTVKTPGSSTRGARRIVTGSAGEYFYTDDHYASFDLVDINS